MNENNRPSPLDPALSIPPRIPNGGRRFHVIACHVLWRELCRFASESGNVFTFSFLKQGLHNTPDILRRELQAGIDGAPEECDAVLIGYGLCSNGAAGIRARNKPLVFMRGHDCITFLLGSKELYREYFDANPGTYWYSAGWLETTLMPGPDRERKLREYYEKTFGADNAAFLMESELGWIRNYSRAAYIETGAAGEAGEAACREYSRECARALKWDFRVFKGRMDLIRGFLEGRWPESDFLTVEPGRETAASYDGLVMKSVPSGTT